MRKLLILALAMVAVLGVVSSATAKSRDRNHDRLPDRWERAHHLSLKVKQAKRDQDRDGLNNRGEFRAKTDPRDEDSDDDGITDGNEHAGTIKSFDGGVLTITLAQGGELSATVDGETEIECHANGDLEHARSSSEGDDDGPNHEVNDDHGDGDLEHGDNDGEDGDDVNEHGDDDDDRCGADALEPGTKVHEAELEMTPKGKRWEELELLAS